MDNIIRLGLLLIIVGAWLMAMLVIWLMYFFYSLGFNWAIGFSAGISLLMGLILWNLLKSKPNPSSENNN